MNQWRYGLDGVKYLETDGCVAKVWNPLPCQWRWFVEMRRDDTITSCGMRETEAEAMRASVDAIALIAQAVEDREPIQWESDHQQRVLRSYGLDERFPYGCDAIDSLADSYVALMRRNEAMEAELVRLRQKCGPGEMIESDYVDDDELRKNGGDNGETLHF